MMRIIRDRWADNKEELRRVLKEKYEKNNCYSYDDIVKVAFETIFNHVDGLKLDLGKLVSIDNGDYQGTILYIIPFNVYQPTEYQYFMTYIYYGSCSVCDTLQGIMDESGNEQIDDLLALCKDILCNAISPYNYGWRNNPDFDQVEED